MTLVWFEPWWKHTCLASNDNDLIIRHSGIPHNAKVSSIILNETWCLPQLTARTNHPSDALMHWLSNFDFPVINSSTRDSIFWCDVQVNKLKAWNIWDSTRFRMPEIAWFKWVWHKLYVTRYAYLEWMLCLNRLPTLCRLHSFGIDIFLCAWGV